MCSRELGCKTISRRVSEKAYNLKRSKTTDMEENLFKASGNDTSCFDPSSINKLGEYFYARSCISLAKSLLGKVLVRKLNSGIILKGRIVETECYLGIIDKASHSYQGKRTERNEAMFEKPGTAYVYSIYGMYYCFNISSIEEGSAVLLRAVEPLQGKTTMMELRSERRKNETVLKDKDLCNGPSKICQAFNISKKELNKIDLCNSKQLWLEEGPEISGSEIISCKRIGIDSAGEEWANKPLRYYIRNCIYVSKRNKLAEN